MLELCDQLPRLMDYLVEHISYTIISSSQKTSSAPTCSSSTGLNLCSTYCDTEQGRPTWKEMEAITRCKPGFSTVSVGRVAMKGNMKGYARSRDRKTIRENVVEEGIIDHEALEIKSQQLEAANTNNSKKRYSWQLVGFTPSSTKVCSTSSKCRGFSRSGRRRICQRAGGEGRS